MHLRPVWIALLACLAPILISGCLYDRVVTLKGNMCDFDSNFVLHSENNLNFTFNDPILLDSDILRLAGSKPTAIKKSDQNMVMTYVIEKTNSDDTAEEQFRIELSFIQRDGEYRLREINSDVNPGLMLNPELISELLTDSMPDQICQAGMSFASTRLEYEISEQKIALLPNREEIIRFLGEPTTGQANDPELVYEFRVKNGDPDAKKAQLKLWFSSQHDKPVQMQTRYSRYQSVADFEDRELSLRFAL